MKEKKKITDDNKLTPEFWIAYACFYIVALIIAIIDRPVISVPFISICVAILLFGSMLNE